MTFTFISNQAAKENNYIFLQLNVISLYLQSEFCMQHAEYDVLYMHSIPVLCVLYIRIIHNKSKKSATIQTYKHYLYYSLIQYTHVYFGFHKFCT